MTTHTLIHFAPDLSDVLMESFETVDDALDRAGRMGPARLTYLSVEDDTAPNGIRVSRIERTESGDAIHVDPTGPQVTTLHNALAERPVARFATRTVAIEKTTKLLSARLGETRKEKVVEVQEETKTSRIQQEKERLAEKKGRGGRKQTHTDDMVVVLKVGANPKKAGKINHDRFASMMRVMKSGRCTVAEATAAGATRGDLVYDQEHGYIDIVPA